MDCSNYCGTNENIEEIESEITRVKELISISKGVARDDWEEKNLEYLKVLDDMLKRIRAEGTFHKNGNLREER